MTSPSKPQANLLQWANKSGAFKRPASVFRSFVSRDANSQFPAEANRYHLYVSLACPWAHRVLITRQLKGLSSIIDLSIVHWHMDENGWRFINKDELAQRTTSTDISNGTEDHVYGFDRLRELYFKAEPEYSGRFTVPVLWDTKSQTIVNNESSEIIRMLNTEFNHLVSSEHADVDLYPAALQPSIDEINDWVYDNINNGVYKTGFSTKQEIYEQEVVNVFKHLDKVEALLAGNSHNQSHQHNFLLGNHLTEADIRLYTTIVRFDAVYHQHFKCNLKMIRHDYPHLHKWLQLLYWKIPGFSNTTDFDHIKKHYTKSHVKINPNQITPLGPEPNILPL